MLAEKGRVRVNDMNFEAKGKRKRSDNWQHRWCRACTIDISGHIYFSEERWKNHWIPDLHIFQLPFMVAMIDIIRRHV